jgi:hypothetical protein
MPTIYRVNYVKMPIETVPCSFFLISKLFLYNPVEIKFIAISVA